MPSLLPGFFEVTAWGETPPTINPGDVFRIRYVHAQNTPSSVWVIVHNLNRKVHISLYDDLNEAVDAAIVIDSPNQSTATFGTPVSGYAVVT